MPTGFESWREYNDENNERLRAVYNTKARGSHAIHDASNECHVPNLSKWLHPDKYPMYDRLPNGQYASLGFYALTRGWLGEDPELFYKTFSTSLGQNAEDLDTTDLSRHYDVYRLSFLANGYVLKGSLSIERRRGEVTIRTKEYSCIPASVTRAIGQGEATISFPRTGYLFNRGGNEYLLISCKDRYPNEVQTAYLQDHGDFNHFEGPFSDWHGRDFYLGYIVAIQRSKALPDSEAVALRPEQVDAAILRKLKDAAKIGSMLGLVEEEKRQDEGKGSRKKRRASVTTKKRGADDSKKRRHANVRKRGRRVAKRQSR
jgi:hypothetical protein